MHTDVSDLLERYRDENGCVYHDFDSLIDVITSTVEPTTWDSVGGTSSIARHSVGDTQMLVLSQSEEAHERIAKLLENLREMKQKAGTPADGNLTTRPRQHAGSFGGMGGMGGAMGGRPPAFATASPQETESFPVA